MQKTRKEKWLTDNVQLVGVIDAAIFVLYQTCVVAFVWRHYRLHYDGPHVLSNLWRDSEEDTD